MLFCLLKCAFWRTGLREFVNVKVGLTVCLIMGKLKGVYTKDMLFWQGPMHYNTAGFLYLFPD